MKLLYVYDLLILFVNADYNQYKRPMNYLYNRMNISGIHSDEPSRRSSNSESSCGVRNSEFRIVRGTVAPLGYWPWLVALGYRDRTLDPSFQCGGALISPTVVLTAAHCVHERPELYLVRMGTNDLGSFVGQDWPVKEAIVHAGYNAASNENDIALVKLKTAAKINRHVQLLCLPSSETLVPVGSRLWIAGWGATSYNGPSSRDLMQLSVNLIDTTVCRKAYERFGQAAVFDERVTCAAGEQGRDACQGDSGGPLMWQIDGNFHAIGVISFGYKCAEPDFPGVYTSIPAFMKWIERHI